jgi:NOL1/NOP2/fmu family ribosome biogenesis protein
MSLDKAIAVLQEEVDYFQQGTKNQPAEKSTDWYLLRAKVAGLGLLKQMKVRGYENDPASAERFARAHTKGMRVDAG